ncbi:alpha/beta hydrolase [Sphingobium sp.]|uniref:alpha/beta hydrolase n=1 Tax=Sphingobium sp. TaxID=1912891 RepID=UPI003BB4D960
MRRGTAGLSATIAAALALAGCASAMRHEIYQADATPVDISRWTRAAPTPLIVRTQDGLSLTGYQWPGDPADHDVILFFHGRGSNQGIAARYAEYLTGHGDHVIAVSYRGFGGNPGKPTQAGLVADGRAFVAKARSIAGPDARIYLVGHSLGGAVALHVAATAPVAGVITLSTFDKLEESAPAGMGALIPDKWNNLDAATKIHAPLVMMLGTADKRVAMTQGDALFATARPPATFVTIGDAGHNPDMARIGPLVTSAVEAMDSGALARWPDALPPGWSVRRK